MVGRLLLLTAPWHHLRPLLIPLYKALHTTPTTMVGIDQVSFVSLLDMVSDDLVLQSSLTSLHHSLNPGTKIQRAANTFVATKTDLAAVHVKSRRVWLGVADPSSPTRLVDADAWQEILSSTSTIMSMRSPPVLPVTATADAMASSEMAGLGGLATVADGRTVWFQFRISLTEAREHWNWVGSDMQKHIAVWELLAQFALTCCIRWVLPHTHGPITCHQGTDNSAADATAAKGITVTVGMAQILTQYFVFMRRFHIFSRITHIPGHLNENADAPSRFKDTSVPLNPLLQCRINWPDLVNQIGIHAFQQATRWRTTFRVRPC